jgi:hypothetical protein
LVAGARTDGKEADEEGREAVLMAERRNTTETWEEMPNWKRELVVAVYSRLQELCEHPTPFLRAQTPYPARASREICGELQDGA